MGLAVSILGAAATWNKGPAYHVYTPMLHRTHSAQLFDWIARGLRNVRIGGTYPLAEASRAHADMESRTTTGKLLLIP